MPNPTAGDVHVNRPLTNLSIGYMQNAAGFVADKVFPSIPVENQGNSYFEYDRSDFWRDQFRKRAPGTESAGSGWKLTTSTYYAHVWALHKDIADQIRANADAPINLDRDATMWLSQQAMISREVNWAANYFTTGIWKGVTGSAQDITGEAASVSSNYGVLQWNDANSTPIADVKLYSDTIWLLTGYRPNKLVLGRQAWTQLSEHPDIVDRIKYSSSPSNPTIVSKQAVAALMELDEVLVADGIQVTSNENPTFEASMTTAAIVGKKALLVYAAPNASILQPSGGYTFSWTGYLGAGAMGQRISRFRMEHIRSDRIEAEMAFDQKLTCATCGVFFNNIVA